MLNFQKTKSVLFLALEAGPPKPIKAVTLRFWAKPGAKKDPRVISIQPHELCSGDLATSRVTEIPAPKVDKFLEPEIAFEIGPKGTVIHRWAIPAEFIVVGIRGNDLMLTPSSMDEPHRVLVISTNRSVHYETARKALPAAKPSDQAYPSLNKELSGHRVEFIPDQRSKANRVIAYPEPCT